MHGTPPNVHEGTTVKPLVMVAAYCVELRAVTYYKRFGRKRSSSDRGTVPASREGQVTLAPPHTVRDQPPSSLAASLIATHTATGLVLHANLAVLGLTPVSAVGLVPRPSMAGQA